MKSCMENFELRPKLLDLASMCQVGELLVKEIIEEAFEKRIKHHPGPFGEERISGKWLIEALCRLVTNLMTVDLEFKLRLFNRD